MEWVVLKLMISLPHFFAFKKLNQGHTNQLFDSSTMTSFLTLYELKQFVYVIKTFLDQQQTIQRRLIELKKLDVLLCVRD